MQGCVCAGFSTLSGLVEVSSRSYRLLALGPMMIRLFLLSDRRARFDRSWRSLRDELVDGATERGRHRIVVRDYMQYWLRSTGLLIATVIAPLILLDLVGAEKDTQRRLLSGAIAIGVLAVIWLPLFVGACYTSRLAFARRGDRLAPRPLSSASETSE
jgi:hypothetical protein